MNTQTYIASITHPKTLAGQAGFKEAQIRGGDGLVPGSHGETPKPRGRGRPRPFLESVFLAGRVRTACTTSLLALLLLLALPATLHAQFNYTITNGTVTITGYTGPGGDVTIPDTINGLPVTCIGDAAFYNGGRPLPYTLTSITIPDSVISIGGFAFAWNYTLRSARLGYGLRTIGDGAFADCGLIGVWFEGDAPSLGGPNVFLYGASTVYYLAGTTGWGSTFGGVPTALWLPFTYTTTNSTITITGYTSPARTIPDTINGLPVTGIGPSAFSGCTSLTNGTIPSSVTSIGERAFAGCSGLTRVTLPNSVTTIGDQAFFCCTNLTSVTLPNSVTSIGEGAFVACTALTSVTIPNSLTNIPAMAFMDCTSLTNITIPNGVTSIGDRAFEVCSSLAGVYFQGNPPSLGSALVFDAFDNTTIYYLPGTTSWGTTFGGLPTALWYLPNPLILTGSPGFGVQSNAFGFIISWATNLPVVVEACTNPANHSWSPVQTNALTGGWSYFSDPQWANYPVRFYRLRHP
jgi:hypothetical protein